VRCPECNSTITKANYDPEFEWYECPNCEGSFTSDEILKAAQEKVGSSVTAKGKLRRTQVELDETAEAHVKVVTISSKGSASGGRVSLPTKEVINVMADAVEEIYEEFHSSINRVNAEDKAIILFREIAYGGSGVPVREKEFHLPLCKEHR
jgi:hypothetical protein